MRLTPRQIRALSMLGKNPVSRATLDEHAGCSNSPALIAGLRRMGLALPCTMVPCRDRDGRKTHYGLYRATGDDRRKIAELLGDSE
ncbi:hypothetical protein BJI67_05395 [Acidihalobacter aeolianus]|uniref:HTH marR-type domain-containing protein n=1 Tax=Acidihalobacter aeolianus TaxID=2792603 RepID=A0A1D8K6I6_9GAMM|nr:hypothetical protein [Acidihalobacter aeolianus]AOV16579.1 hypothetical protein BJI67_05395 [Acidihalobacter aeolianus]